MTTATTTATAAAHARTGMKHAASGVEYLQLSIVNVVFVEEATRGSWVLIDGGLGYAASRILRAAEARFGKRPPTAILLTHGHFDHVGALPTLLKHWHVPIYASELEIPYLTGRQAYPPPDPSVGGGLMSRISKLYSRGPFDFGGAVQPLPPDGAVPGLDGWRWLPTPGHCQGHVSFFRDADRVLVSGDALVTVRQESLVSVLTQHMELRPPPAYFTTDWNAALNSIQKIAELRCELIVPGHGRPMQGEAFRTALQNLIGHWVDDGLPNHGRYVPIH